MYDQSNIVCKKGEKVCLETIMEKLLSGYAYNREDIQKIVSSHAKITMAKGEVFCESGKPTNRIGILTEGLLLSYYENENSEIEVSRYFDVPINMVVTDFDAYSNRLPCTETIKAIEPSTLYVINREAIEKLYKEVPVFNIIGRKIAEYGVVMCSRRIQALQTLDTEKRFMKLFKINPALFNRISKKDMASFLKMNRNLVTRYLKRI